MLKNIFSFSNKENKITIYGHNIRRSRINTLDVTTVKELCYIRND